MADADAVSAAIERCRAQLGDVDILVNNAGIVNNIALIAEMTPEAWDHEMRVNLTGMFQFFAPRFKPVILNPATGAVVSQ